MKLFIFALTFLSLINVHAAGSLGDLENCRRQCSTSCRDLAERAIQLAHDIQDDCDDSSHGDPDVIDACKSVFYISSEQLECTRGARSADAVRACSSVFYITSEKMACATTAIDGDAVKACASSFYITAERLDCAKYARSKAHVEKCVSSYYTTSDRMKCLGKP